MAKQTVKSTVRKTAKGGMLAGKILKAKAGKDGFVKAGGKFESFTTLALTGNPNETFEMYYLETKEINSDKFENGTAKLHLFLLKDTGEIVQVWGAGQLNYLLETITPGVLTRIRWVDKVKVQLKGTKKKVAANQFEVEYNEDDTVEVNDHI